MLLNLSRAWEQADTSTSNGIASQLPSLEIFLTDNVKAGKDEIANNLNQQLQYELVPCFHLLPFMLQRLANVWYLLEEDSRLWECMVKESHKG